MKRKLTCALLVITLLFTTLALSSCDILDYAMNQYFSASGENSGGENNNDDNQSAGGTNDMSDANLTINAGDNYNVTINSAGESDLLAASRGLLSAVSVSCNFKVKTSMGYGPSSQVYESTAQSSGSGVIYKLNKESGDAYIITNYHVVYYYQSSTSNYISNDINIYLYGMEYDEYAIPATYVGGSMQYDLAVLKVEDSLVLAESSAMAAEFADSNDVSALETAIAIGNPEANGISATVGCVNVESENITMTAADEISTVTMRLMRIDTPVNSGNSGGGLYNREGKLIGIVNAKLSSSSVENIGYAIPSNIVKYITENILYYCDGTDEECVYRCLLGIRTALKSSKAVYDTETGKVHIVEEVKISGITTDSVAEGLFEVGDLINSITIDGVTYEVSRTYHVVDAMLNARTTSTVSMNITRDGQTLDIEVDLSKVTPTAAV
ncbi:MAG: trypsin-like peptidase domain-containing protein [Clostridia bacterium]|nr:trypsin-like peptidase domain-containing protein [Clostridia bacterium]